MSKQRSMQNFSKENKSSYIGSFFIFYIITSNQIYTNFQEKYFIYKAHKIVYTSSINI